MMMMMMMILFMQIQNSLLLSPWIIYAKRAIAVSNRQRERKTEDEALIFTSKNNVPRRMRETIHNYAQSSLSFLAFYSIRLVNDQIPFCRINRVEKEESDFSQLYSSDDNEHFSRY